MQSEVIRGQGHIEEVLIPQVGVGRAPDERCNQRSSEARGILKRFRSHRLGWAAHSACQWSMAGKTSCRRYMYPMFHAEELERQGSSSSVSGD